MSFPDLNFVLDYLDQVKDSFYYKPKKFQRLQTLWENYLARNLNFRQLLDNLSSLFSDNSQLAVEFNKLLPPEFRLKTINVNCINEEKESKAAKELMTGCKRSRSESINHAEDSLAVKKFKPSGVEDLNYLKYGSWDEYAFFDKVKQLLGNEDSYLNFLRCIQLFNKNLIDGVDLFETLEPFVSKSPSVMSQLKRMLHHHLREGIRSTAGQGQQDKPVSLEEEIKDYEIDFSSSRKKGSSYRALKLKPDDRPVSSGRTDLCREVLNDVWVSFPLWSEDPATTSESQGGCKITSIQEFFYKCEDERFELDIVIDNVSSTIKVLEDVAKKMSAMSQEEIMAFRLDDSLGGSSQVLQKKVIERIYGDKANDLMNGLKMKPFIAVPIALRRLKAKEQEWKDHRVKFNKIWRENTEKHSQRSSNCELAAVKQNDLRDSRTKVIINESEAVQYESRMLSSIYGPSSLIGGTHFSYSEQIIFQDLNDLLNYNLTVLVNDNSSNNSNNNNNNNNNVATSTSAIANSSAIGQTNSTAFVQFSSICLEALSILDALCSSKYYYRNCETQTHDSASYVNSRDELGYFNCNAGSFESSLRPTEMTGGASNSIPATGLGAAMNDCSDESVMYQTNRWLVFVSLHHKLYARLVKIKSVSDKELLDRNNSADTCDGTTSYVSKKKFKSAFPGLTSRDDCSNLYDFALTMLRSLIRGSCDPVLYEEHVRRTIGKVRDENSFNYNDVSYWIISLDKLLKNVVRELQQLACDETTRSCSELYREFQDQLRQSKSSSFVLSAKYKRQALKLLSEDSCYKITFKKSWNKVVAELIDLSQETKEDFKVVDVQIWQEYVSDYLQREVTDASISHLISRPFLKRNLRKELPEDLCVSGCDQCLFLPNSYKLHFSMASHSVMSRRRRSKATLKKLKSQSVARNFKFSSFWNKWQTRNITPLIEQKFKDWFVGSKRTKILDIPDTGKPPYRSYRKYLCSGRLQ